MSRVVGISLGGSTKRTQSFLRNVQKLDYTDVIKAYAEEGRAALAAATPVDTTLTANSWSYEIEITGDKTSIWWVNSNRQNGINIAILLQYGHGTGTGGFVAGRDYINPAIKPIFDRISEGVWKKVTML